MSYIPNVGATDYNKASNPLAYAYPGSDANAIPASSGVQNLGSLTKPFNELYVNAINSSGASGEYVDVAGDTMTGSLNFAGSAKLTANSIVKIQGASGMQILATNGSPLSSFGAPVPYSTDFLGSERSLTIYATSGLSVSPATSFSAAVNMETTLGVSGVSTFADAVNIGSVKIENGGATFTNTVHMGVGDVHFSGGNMVFEEGTALRTPDTFSITSDQANSQITISASDGLYISGGLGEIQTLGNLHPSVSGVGTIGTVALPYAGLTMCSSGGIAWRIRVTDAGVVETY